MPVLSRVFFLVAGVSLALAAMLSAYGFHGLPGKVPVEKIASWEWATQMQFYNSLGLILLGLLLRQQPGSVLMRIAGGLMMLGLLVFCGGIYLEVLGAPAVIGDAAPIGGSSFMLGWLLTGIAGWRLRA
jgi:uncharacterized membrane protein YgdD (TMEM256/DUF423 family)